MLNDAWQVGNAHVAECIGSMASIVEDEPISSVDCVHEIRAEADGESDDADEISRRRVIFDVVGL